MNKAYSWGFVGMSWAVLLAGCGSDLVVGSGNTGGQGNEAGVVDGGESGAGDGGEGGTPGGATHASKLDVLFVVDNSVNMAMKQRILAASLPSFVERLVNPRCVDAAGVAVAEQPSRPDEPCSEGTREHAPLSDLHFGVISTSLGAHGGTICASPPVVAGDRPDDRAELLGAAREGVASYADSGFAAFDAAGKVGSADVSTVVTQLQSMVTAAGETGCGYEAPLEAMYRFLIDPEPPLEVKTADDASVSPTGINDTLLRQRVAFLRPDSALAIVLLSDENDCSLRDDASGARITGTDVRLPRGTRACESDPESACCRPCTDVEDAPPSGCEPLDRDPACTTSEGEDALTWDRAHDLLNVRCFDQKQRFGFDALQPLERYRKGLTQARVPKRDGSLVSNPLFVARDGVEARSPALVTLTAIAGVPWQDLAPQGSFAPNQPLTYLAPDALVSEARWPLMLGTPALDPFMRESIVPRQGTNPLAHTPITPETSRDPQANPINGHEQVNVELDDLQFACTFALTEPVICGPGANTCSCSPDRNGDTAYLEAGNSPLCQPPTGGPASTTQYYGGAYPGTRQLQLVQALGARATAASLCPKTLDESAADFGYVPALEALLRNLAPSLR